MTRILTSTLSIMLIFAHVASARDFTKPTSIALRTEVSFVNEATLIEKKHVEGNEWQLTFKLIADIHNKSPKEITTLVSAELAKSLATDVNYIMAYRTHRKAKVKGLVEYLPLDKGATLIQVEGGNPAIYRFNQKIKDQLLIDPKIAQTEPLKLIETIMKGIQTKDPKVQEFFVRELVNWVGLPDYLTQDQHDQLLAVFNSSEASVGTLTALLENRTAFHQSLGIDKMTPQVHKLLEILPTQSESNSEIPALVLQALNFINNHGGGDWYVFSRWTRSNVPSITEKSLMALHKIDPEKTMRLAKERSTETHISDTSRRVLTRYITNKNNLVKAVEL